MCDADLNFERDKCCSRGKISGMDCIVDESTSDEGLLMDWYDSQLIIIWQMVIDE